MRHSIFYAVILSFIPLSHSAASADPVMLHYMSWDPVQLAQEQSAIDKFVALHPGVSVKTQAMPPKDYWPHLSALAASGDLPDIMMMSSAYIQQWVQAGNLADLTVLLKQTDLNAYTASTIQTARINNGLYALPQSWSGPVLFYNKDAFDAAGLAYPASDWTWDKFLHAAHQLTIDSNGDGQPDQWGYYLYGRYAHIDGWIYRNGGRYLNEDATALTPNPQAIHALQFLTDLVIKEKVAPAPKDMQGLRQEDIFPLGLAAMWVDGSWNIANNRTIIGNQFKWGIAEIPAGPDATAETIRSYAWPDMLAVSAHSKQQQLAAEFLTYMTGEARSAKDFLGGKVPAYKALAAREEWLERDLQPDNKQILFKIGEQQLYTGFSKGWDAWRGYGASGSAGMNGELDEVFNGRKTLEQAIKSFTAYGNDILNR